MSKCTPEEQPSTSARFERLVGVLVVDDIPLVRNAVRHVIASAEGFVLVAEAASGEAALELAHRLQPDLALVDVELPGISGITVARRLTTSSPRIVVILMSVSDALLRTQAVTDSGAAAAIEKKDLAPRMLRELWMRHRPDAP